MATSTAGESVTFTLNQTTAFFLRGTLNYDHGHKSVTFTPHSNAGQATTTTILDYSTTLDFEQILYWQSGLDRDQSYTVQITQLADGTETSFSFSSLDIIDGCVYSCAKYLLSFSLTCSPTLLVAFSGSPPSSPSPNSPPPAPGSPSPSSNSSPPSSNTTSHLPNAPSGSGASSSGNGGQVGSDNGSASGKTVTPSSGLSTGAIVGIAVSPRVTTVHDSSSLKLPLRLPA